MNSLSTIPAKTRLAAGLLAALFAVAACDGPTIHNDQPGAGSRMGNYQVTIRTDPPSLKQGQKATMNYAFTDTRTGKQVTDLPVVGDATVRSTVVNRDLTWFRTGKAVGPVGGAYPVNLRFGDQDTYRLFVEFSSAYTPTQQLLYKHALSYGNHPPALEGAAPLTESASKTNAFYGVGVTLNPGTLHAKQPATLHYTLTTAGGPVKDLAGFDGALGHLFIVSADGEAFSHLLAREPATGTMNGQNEPTAGGSSGSLGGNPESRATAGAGTPVETPAAGATTTVTPTSVAAQGGATAIAGQAGPTAQATPNLGTGLGPDLTFEHEFEKPGLYKTWMQFLYHGEVVTADYVVRVEP